MFIESLAAEDASVAFDFDVLSIHDDAATMVIDPISLNDEVTELELLPLLVDLKVSTPRVLSVASGFPVPPPLPPSSPPSRPREQPSARRRRCRKRSDREKAKENTTRRTKQVLFLQRRKASLQQEQQLRSHVRAWICEYADAIGVATDAQILPFLPAELRHIMARADAAVLLYRDFAGAEKINHKINQLPQWW